MSLKKNSAKKPREKTFSVADILMVLGFLALGYSTFMGTKLLTGDFTDAVIAAAATLGGSMLFLWIICMAKKAHNHRQAWLVLELAMIVVFVCIFFVFTDRARHYHYITTVKDNLHKEAVDDRDEILSLFGQYEKQEKDDMGTIYNSMKALPTDRQLYANEETAKLLNEWEGENTIKPGGYYSNNELKSAAQSYYDVLDKHVLFGENYNKIKNEYTKRLNEITNSIGNSNDYGQYHAYAMSLSKVYETLAAELTALSAKDQKYELEYNYGSGRLQALPLHKVYTAKTDNLKFIRHFDGTSRSKAAGWWYTAAILLLIMCSYFATKRSRRVTVLSNGLFNRKKSFTQDGGIDIC